MRNFFTQMKRLRKSDLPYVEEKVPPRGFLDISQYQSIRIGPEFEEVNPTSLPDLFKPLRTLDLKEKTEKSKNNKKTLNNILNSFSILF